MATVTSDFIDISFYRGVPNITALWYQSLVPSGTYDPQTGEVTTNSPIVGNPVNILANDNTIIPILAIDNTRTIVTFPTGLDQNNVTVSAGEGRGLALLFPYVQDIVIPPNGRVVLEGTNLWMDGGTIGAWTDATHTFLSQPNQNALQLVAGNSQGTVLVCTMQQFGYWPYPGAATSLAYSPSDLLIAGDITDGNLNFKMGLSNGSIDDTSGLTTWITHGTPTVEPQMGMGPSAWPSFPDGSPFVNNPYAEFATGFTNNNCYQVDEASVNNWTGWQWWNVQTGDPFMVQIICTSPPQSNFLPDRCLFNVGTAGFDGFRILVGDRSGGFYTQSLILQWEYADVQDGPRIGTREIRLDFPNWNYPLVITAVRTGADSTGATWRLLLNGTSNWFPNYGNDWPVLWAGNDLNCYLGAYHEVPANWDSGVTYQTAQKVRFNGVDYYSLIFDNIGNEPTPGGDANWAVDAVINAWPGNIWAARWVNNFGAPFDQTLIENQYTTFDNTPQISQIINPLKPMLATFWYSEWQNATYDPGTGDVTLQFGDIFGSSPPKYLVGTSGNLYTVTGVKGVALDIVTIDTGLSLDEIYNGNTLVAPTSGRILGIYPAYGDGGHFITYNTPISLALGTPTISAVQNSSQVTIDYTTQTMPPTVPSVPDQMSNWQTGTFVPPSIYHPSTPSAGPGISPYCNPAYPSGDWSGSYHGLDGNGYGIWDCNAWAPPAVNVIAYEFLPNTLLYIRGGPFVADMSIMISSLTAANITFTKYTGGGNPGPGEYKYIDGQTILLRAPSSYPAWCTNLWSDNYGGSIAPSQKKAYNSYSATMYGYVYPYGNTLSYWQYDYENGYYGWGSRALLVGNGSGTYTQIPVWCANPVGAAF